MQRIPALDITPAQSGEKIHVRLFSGRFQTLRRLISWPLLLAYFGLAWININGLIIDEFCIPKCCDKLLRQGKGTVQTVEEVDHHHPNYLFRGAKIGLIPYCMHPDEYTPSQMFERLWAGVGACIGGYDPPRPGPRAGIYLSKYTYFELHEPIELEVARGLYEYKPGHSALKNCEAKTHEQT